MRQFIADHAADDTRSLLLAAARYPRVDVPFAVIQIESHRRIREKLPRWFAARDRLVFSSRRSVEQCSSEAAARYKQRPIEGAVDSPCDLTGGLGVAPARSAEPDRRVSHVERDAPPSEPAAPSRAL